MWLTIEKSGVGVDLGLGVKDCLVVWMILEVVGLVVGVGVTVVEGAVNFLALPCLRITCKVWEVWN